MAAYKSVYEVGKAPILGTDFTSEKRFVPSNGAQCFETLFGGSVERSSQ